MPLHRTALPGRLHKLLDAPDRPLQALRPLRSDWRTPPGAGELGQPGRVGGSNGSPAAGTRHHVFADVSATRPACEVDDEFLWVGHTLGVLGNPALRHAQKARCRLAIREQPGLHFAQGDPKAKLRSRIRQPFRAEERRAIGFVVEVHKDNPRRVPGGLIEPCNSLPKVGLPPASIDGARVAAGMADQPAYDGFVHNSFDRRTDDG